MATTTPPRARQARESVVIRFAGDSGDGMQVTGSRFTVEAALAGNDLTTFPDFPAEIRAPAGTTYGVSAFQIHLGVVAVMNPGVAAGGDRLAAPQVRRPSRARSGQRRGPERRACIR